MISTSIRPLIFHILFTTAIGNISVKILQINLSNTYSFCDNLKCDTNFTKNNSNLIDFIKSKQPDVVLCAMFRTNCSFLQKITNLQILPIVTSSVDDCYLYHEKITFKNCYYSFNLTKSKIRFLILNTFLWIKESHIAKQQLDWLREQLKIINLQNEKVIIAGFQAPGSSEVSNGSLNYAQPYNEELVELFVKYSRIIKACFFGDENIDTFRILLNRERIPVLPIFISPFIRVYTYNQTTNELDNYFVYRKMHSPIWEETYNGKAVYGLTNMNVTSWFKLAKSFLNDTNYFKTYFKNLLKTDPFEKYCKDKYKCNQKRSFCFITALTKNYLFSCLNQGNSESANDDNGLLFVFAVIAGFVIILVGIVLAVNKVYCIRRGRQRNIFLAPLTLNIQAEMVDDTQNTDLNDKLPISKDAIDSQIRNSNGFRRSNHEVEQTYNYIRM